MIRILSFSLCIFLAPGCQKKEPSATKSPQKPPEKTTSADSPPAAASDHGGETSLGRASLAGFEFDVAALGSVRAGSDAAIAVKVVKSPEDRDWRTINLYIWVEDANGAKLCPAEKARVEKGRLHGHASIPASARGTPATVVIRLRDGEVDERTSVGLATAGGDGSATAPRHTHDKTPHDGVLARVLTVDGGAPAGWLELKLHDDKGDLELWLTHDKAATRPLDLPTNAAISVTFVDHANREVSLAPRNTEKNEDEDGKPNMRDGKTSYFIFPGATGADASWLMGKQFQSIVSVTVETPDRKLTSDEFVLKPHTHEEGAEH